MVHAVVLNSFDKLYVDRFGLRILTETENIDFLGSAIVTTESYARAQRDVVIRFLRSAAPKYQLKSLPGNFSGLHLVCLMYVAFKSIAPDTDVGFDLSKEYAAAQALHGEK